MLRKLLNWIGNKLKKKEFGHTPLQKGTLQVIEFEEEALKRLERIGKLRDSIHNAAERRIKKVFPLSEEESAEVAEDREITWEDLKSGR